MSHISLHSVIDVECVTSVSNIFNDIISFIIKVCRWFLLNNKIFTFHDLFIFIESVNKQQSLFPLITINYYMCGVGGGGYCELLVHLADLFFIVHAILLFQVHP